MTTRNPDDAAMCRVEIKVLVRVGDDDMVEPRTFSAWSSIAADPVDHLAAVVLPEVSELARQAADVLDPIASRIMWGADA